MILTERLSLRPLRPEDRATMRALWADPAMTADLGGPRDAAGVDAIIERHAGYADEHGLGFGIVERRSDGVPLGFAGLKPGAAGTPIEGELEIGWALAPVWWGHGYGIEAARGWRDWAWANRDERRIVAITTRRNAASIAVMAKLGMTHHGDFRHPAYAADDPAGDSVFYAVDRAAA